MNVSCQLYSDWIADIRHELTSAGFDHSVLKDQDCAIRWQAWKRRLAPPGVRTVHKAATFHCPPSLQQGLADLEQAITTGAPLWPWQSKLIDKPTFEDGLYNDYRVTHFHLGIGFETNGYAMRTGELLFAVVDSSSLYEIGIYNHGDWYELDILEMIDSQWPHLLDRVTLQGFSVAGCLTTRDEVKAIRQAHIVPVIQLPSGRIISPPGGGVATDGTSIEAVREADRWARCLRAGEELIATDIQRRVQSGQMPDRDYIVRLDATDNEIAGVAENGYKWTLWRRTQ